MLIKMLGALLALAVFVPPVVAQQMPVPASQNSLQSPRRIPKGWVVLRQPSTAPQCGDQGPLIIPPCPDDLTLVIFDQPVYDNDGLFIVCLKKVPYCIDPNNIPAG
jgi:hypothetical protein